MEIYSIYLLIFGLVSLTYFNFLFMIKRIMPNTSIDIDEVLYVTLIIAFIITYRIVNENTMEDFIFSLILIGLVAAKGGMIYRYVTTKNKKEV